MRARRATIALSLVGVGLTLHIPVPWGGEVPLGYALVVPLAASDLGIGAQLAAAMGLPYAFASHFAPAMLTEAMAVYHRDFRPSKHLREPYAMLALNVVAADTRAEAEREFTALQQMFAYLRRPGQPGKVPLPVDDINSVVSPQELAAVGQALSCSVVGDAKDVAAGIADFVERHRPNELILTANLAGLEARKRSFELAAQAWGLRGASDT